MAECFFPIGLGGGGATFGPAISPHDANLLFVASDMGGVYRSEDGGETWMMIDKRQLRDTGGCPVAFHPRNSDVIYAVANGGFKISADRGVTWSALCADPPWKEARCSAIEIDEENLAVMYIGGAAGAHCSIDGGRNWSDCLGVEGSVVGIALLGDKRICLIATSAGIFRYDSNGMWQRSDTGLPFREVRGLAAGQSRDLSQSIAYATLPTRRVHGRLVGGVWRSVDGGKSWHAVASVRGESLFSFRRRSVPPQYERVQTARCAAEVAYVTIRRGEHVAIHRSDDAGATWRPVVAEVPGAGAGRNMKPGWLVSSQAWNEWNGASWGFTVNRRNPDVALFTNDGEIYRTTDGGAAWAPIYARLETHQPLHACLRSSSIGLEVTSAWQFSFDPHDPERAYICYTDIGFARSLDRGATWSHSTRGIPWSNTVYQIAFEPAVPGVIYAACSTQHDIPHWTNIEKPEGKGGVCVSCDWGATWEPIGRGLPNAPATSIVLDPRSPVNARRLYVTQFGAGVYTSGDGGASWQPTASRPGGASNRHFFRLKWCDDGTLYCTITGRREGLTFPVAGGLYRSRDGGHSWTDLTAGMDLRWPGDVEAAPNDHRIIYLGVASTPGHPQGGVYKSCDGGKSWKCVLSEAQLPQDLCTYAHALFVSVDPLRPDTVYAGATKHGLFVSRDAGATWQEVPGIPFPACQRVGFDPLDRGALWVTTFGAGVWRGKIELPP